MNIEKRLFREVLRFRGLFIFTVLSGVFAGIFTVSAAFLFSRLLDRAFLKKWPIEKLLPLALLFGVTILFRVFFLLLQRRSAAQLAWLIKRDLRQRLVEHLFKIGPIPLKAERTGELTNTLTQGIESLEAYVAEYLPQLFITATVPVLVLLFVVPIDLLSAAIFTITAPLIPLFMILIGKAADRLTKKQWKTLSFMSAHFLDILQGLVTLKIFGKSREKLFEISKISDEFRVATLNVLKVAFVSALVLELVATLSTAIIAVQVGLRLLYARLEFERAFFILLLAPEFYLPFRVLGTKFHSGMAVTRERIRQIEAKALRKLRHPSRSEQLRSFLDE